MKDEFAELRARTYSYLINDSGGDKKATGIKKCVIKIKLKFEDYENYLEELNLKIK